MFHGLVGVGEAENRSAQRFNPLHGEQAIAHGLARDRGFKDPCVASYGGITGINNGLSVREQPGGPDAKRGGE
jgi:hypothetical protein